MSSGRALGALFATGTLLCCLAAFCASRSFVSTPASSTPHLRAKAAHGSQETPHTGASSSLGIDVLAAGSVASLFVAVGLAAARRSSVVCKAEARGEELSCSFSLAKEEIPRPENLLVSEKYPIMPGNTGGYMSKATRERHAITWTAKVEAVIELPTGGLCIMNAGENLAYFRKKEQALCLGKELRKMKIDNYKVYRIKKDGTVIFLHPADGVFPEKVNKGRVQVNGRPFPCGSNVQKGPLKGTVYWLKPYEADPLTTMFVKAKIEALADPEQLYSFPTPSCEIPEEEWPEMKAKAKEAGALAVSYQELRAEAKKSL